MSGRSKGRRGPSLLEDDDFAEVGGRDESSSGDVCEACGCTRIKHDDDGCACGRCMGFSDG